MTKRTSKRSADRRHAKPSDSVILNRIYRRQIRMDAKLTRTMRTLAEDFTRVIRQNDTLRGENETLKAVIAAKERAEMPMYLHCTVCGQNWNGIGVHECSLPDCPRYPTAPIDTSDLALANAYMNRPKRQAG